MEKQTTKKKSSFVPHYRRIYDDLKEKIQDAKIHPQVMGSDHCPAGLELDL
jgi:exodeoxyribonuclease-3